MSEANNGDLIVAFLIVKCLKMRAPLGKCSRQRDLSRSDLATIIDTGQADVTLLLFYLFVSHSIALVAFLAVRDSNMLSF